MRFRKRVRLLPGVHLNFSKSGVSTTIGVPGLSMNLGPKGTYLNTGIPGTGLYDRKRLDGPRRQRPIATPTAPTPVAPNPDLGEGVDPELLNNLGLGWLRAEIRSNPDGLVCHETHELAQYLQQVHQRRRQAAQTLHKLQPRWRNLATGLAAFGALVLVKAIFQLSNQVINTLGAMLMLWVPYGIYRFIVVNRQIRRARRDTTELRVNVDVALGDDLAQAWQQLQQAFERLAAAHRVWDITHQKSTTNRKGQDLEGMNRVPVALRLGLPAFVDSPFLPLELGNANGGTLYLFPTFALVLPADGPLGTLHLNKLGLAFSRERFVEEGPIPADAQVVDHTWKEVNRDGTPDRRFKHNPKLPIAEYGRLEWKGGQGNLHEIYLASNADAADAFVDAYATYVATLAETA